MVSQQTIVNVLLALTVVAMTSMGGLAYNYQPGGSASVIPPIAEARPISSPAFDAATLNNFRSLNLKDLNVRHFGSSLSRNEIALRTHEALLNAGYSFNLRNFKKPVVAANDIVVGAYTKVGATDVVFLVGTVNIAQRQPISLFNFPGANTTNLQALSGQLGGANSFLAIYTGTGLQTEFAEAQVTPLIEEIS